MTFKFYHVLRGTLAAIGSVSLVVGSAAPAIAAPPTPNSFEEIEALCPSVGTTGLTFGVTREQQDQTALAKVTAEDPTRLFREAIADYSPWSDRLYRLSWYSWMDDGDPSDGADWPRSLAQLLEEGGWQAEVGGTYPPPFDLAWGEWRYSKEFTVDGAPRQLLIEIQKLANFALDCADIELAAIADNEGLGILEPGSSRPVMPEVTKVDLPDPATCDRPDIQDMFSTNEKLEAAGHKIFPKASAEGVAARFGERLRTWLVWKMLDSGKIRQEDIWQVEEGLYPDASEERQDDLIGFLEDAGAIVEAQKRGDGQTVCQKFLSLFAKQRVADERQAARWAKLNAALEAEAVRRGIALD